MQGLGFRVEGPGFGVEDLDVKLAQQLLIPQRCPRCCRGGYMARTDMGF